MQMGREAMIIQGFPLAKVPGLVQSTRESLLMDLGGNMMAAVLPLAVLHSLFVSLIWRIEACDFDRPLALSAARIADAMACFESMDVADGDPEEERAQSTLKRRRKCIE